MCEFPEYVMVMGFEYSVIDVYNLVITIVMEFSY